MLFAIDCGSVKNMNYLLNINSLRSVQALLRIQRCKNQKKHKKLKNESGGDTVCNTELLKGLLDVIRYPFQNTISTSLEIEHTVT